MRTDDEGARRCLDGGLLEQLLTPKAAEAGLNLGSEKLLQNR